MNGTWISPTSTGRSLLLQARRILLVVSQERRIVPAKVVVVYLSHDLRLGFTSESSDSLHWDHRYSSCKTHKWVVERVIRIQSMSGHQQVAGGRVLQTGKQTPLSLSWVYWPSRMECGT